MNCLFMWLRKSPTVFQCGLFSRMIWKSLRLVPEWREIEHLLTASSLPLLHCEASGQHPLKAGDLPWVSSGSNLLPSRWGFAVFKSIRVLTHGWISFLSGFVLNSFSHKGRISSQMHSEGPGFSLADRTPEQNTGVSYLPTCWDFLTLWGSWCWPHPPWLLWPHFYLEENRSLSFSDKVTQPSFNTDFSILHFFHYFTFHEYLSM